MKLWVKDPTLCALRILAVFGTVHLACSGPPQGGTTLLGEPSVPAKEQVPFDPLKPGASVLCDMQAVDEPEAEPAVYMLSAMNHKLRHYPEFAAAIGVDLVAIELPAVSTQPRIRRSL